MPKTANPTTVEDLRPINILPALSKAFEHIIYDQLSQFLEANNVLHQYQSGFRSKHSTCTALIKVTDDCRAAMDNRQIMLLALLDFTKAFQTIDHDIMIAKLSYHYNFSHQVLCWFRSYLTDRKQKVIVNDTLSNSISVPCGVPQGSILGPLLFSLYINDLPKHISYSRYHLYADDVQCYIPTSPSNLTNSINNLNTDIENICTWAQQNGLIINPAKSKFMLVGSRRLLSSITTLDTINIVVNKVAVPLSESVTNLGIQLNRYLNWTDHINKISKKAYGALHSLQRLKNLLPFCHHYLFM